MARLTCFKAYDIRGRLPDELNPEIARDIGRAYAAFLQPGAVVVGRDVRLSSRDLCQALAEGLTAGGADVVDLGLCGTEEIYHATFAGQFDGGIMVTASHNPLDFNGFKLVREGARPISGDSGLLAVRELAESGAFPPSRRQGRVTPGDFRERYIRHLLGYFDPRALRLNRGLSTLSWLRSTWATVTCARPTPSRSFWGVSRFVLPTSRRSLPRLNKRNGVGRAMPTRCSLAQAMCRWSAPSWPRCSRG
jgi:phosphomannomutase